ncbi:UDP-2,3-diacylglucosamine diphosphatase [Halothiobacillus sp. DCM-1]|uniref:UDP-2,3-diacylglucosamine diphosphatase n=1 Tax=Halothiobacillus sp. DCM-1 TaxID=3112558 RepID=UPI00324D7F68
MAETLIIADLHLSAAHPQTAQVQALCARASQAAALYILGDLFDYWVGDDQPLTPELEDALESLAALPCPKFFIAGNRDFLVGQTLLDKLGAQALPDLFVLEQGSQRLLLCHGDTLCTDDLAYQAMRQQLRSPAFRCDFLAKPLAERIAVAEALRARSKTESSQKPEDIMDVNEQSVQAVMTRHEAHVLIHGHTHRPALHRLPAGGLRGVTGDWHDAGWLIACTDQAIRLERFDTTGAGTVVDQSPWPNAPQVSA